jgi:hypothetical protein
MEDAEKSKKQLLHELQAMRGRLDPLEEDQTEHELAGEAL